MLKTVNIEPLNIEGVSEKETTLIENLIVDLLCEWEDTPYRRGMRIKQVGVDCIRFVCEILDKLCPLKKRWDVDIPFDTSLHDPKESFKAYKKLFSTYPTTKVKLGEKVQTGDVLLCGTLNGGLGHAMIVGGKFLWHCDGNSLVRTGTQLTSKDFIKTIRRPKERILWKQFLQM